MCQAILAMYLLGSRKNGLSYFLLWFNGLLVLSSKNCVFHLITCLTFSQGWRFVSPHFSSLLDSAVFPALALNQKVFTKYIVILMPSSIILYIVFKLTKYISCLCELSFKTWWSTFWRSQNSCLMTSRQSVLLLG